MSDKDIERRRYEERARATLERRGIETQRGSGAVPPTLRRPYLAYEAAVRSVLQARCRVLEIGAGTGSHTRVLTEGGAYVVATDIATGALAVLVRGMDDVPPDRVTPCACDMEDLPFRDRSFDVVASAGSLSYGDPEAV